jgi:hypothetical protein
VAIGDRGRAVATLSDLRVRGGKARKRCRFRSKLDRLKRSSSLNAELENSGDPSEIIALLWKNEVNHSNSTGLTSRVSVGRHSESGFVFLVSMRPPPARPTLPRAKFSRSVRGFAIAIFYAFWNSAQCANSVRLEYRTGSKTASLIGYLVGAALMIIGAIAKAWIGIDAERKSLEHVATAYLPSCSGDRPMAVSEVKSPTSVFRVEAESQKKLWRRHARVPLASPSQVGSDLSECFSRNPTHTWNDRRGAPSNGQ